MDDSVLISTYQGLPVASGDREAYCKKSPSRYSAPMSKSDRVFFEWLYYIALSFRPLPGVAFLSRVLDPFASKFCA